MKAKKRVICSQKQKGASDEQMRKHEAVPDMQRSAKGAMEAWRNVLLAVFKENDTAEK